MKNKLDFKWINPFTITEEQFAQIEEIEKNCGLEPFTFDMLLKSITNLDTLGCFDGAKVAGFITIGYAAEYFDGSIYIANLNVAEGYRRRGIAQRLIRESMKMFDEPKKHMVSLDVSKENLQAINLYTKVGFEQTNIQSWNGSTDIVMAAPMPRLLSGAEELNEATGTVGNS